MAPADASLKKTARPVRKGYSSRPWKSQSLFIPLSSTPSPIRMRRVFSDRSMGRVKAVIVKSTNDPVEKSICRPMMELAVPDSTLRSSLTLAQALMP